MKVSIIGAGNVGGLLAMRLIEKDIADVVLIDIVKNLATAKVFDIRDVANVSRINHRIEPGDDIAQVKGSQILVITAGQTRKPGMTREDLLKNNARTITEISKALKNVIDKKTIVIVVSNPVDLMTHLVFKETEVNPRSILGMGVSLDASRFASIISEELNVLPRFINTMVIGSHSENMVILGRYTFVEGKPLKEILPDDKINTLIEKTKNRGSELVSLYGAGSSYFAPSLTALSLIEAIIHDDRKKVVGCCAYLDGEYGLKDIFIGVPVNLWHQGVYKIVQLDLDKEELTALHKSAESIRSSINNLTI